MGQGFESLWGHGFNFAKRNPRLSRVFVFGVCVECCISAVVVNEMAILVSAHCCVVLVQLIFGSGDWSFGTRHLSICLAHLCFGISHLLFGTDQLFFALVHLTFGSGHFVFGSDDLLFGINNF